MEECLSLYSVFCDERKAHAVFSVQQYLTEVPLQLDPLPPPTLTTLYGFKNSYASRYKYPSHHRVATVVFSE